MQLSIANTLSRSKSAHQTQKPSILMLAPRKTPIKLLKQSFPPDFFTNSKKNDEKPSILPKIKDLKAFFSNKNSVVNLISLGIKRENSIILEKYPKRPSKINLDTKKCLDYRVTEEISTPCFPEKERGKSQEMPGKRKRKVFFCKARDYLKI